MPKPNLFIIGAMKSGTTSLHSYLAAHPQVFMSDPKEPTYFVERSQLASIYPEMYKRGYWRGEEYYLRVFDGAGDAKIIGESSTCYTKLNRITDVPQRIASFQPDARFIYVMRDPIERSISHYWHAVHYDGENREILTAVTETPDYRDFSYYAMQLAPYFELFGTERVFIFTLEEMKNDPVRTLRSIFEWLDVDPTVVSSNIAKRRHATRPQIKMVKGAGLLSRFRYSPMWDAIGHFVPRQIRAVGRDLAQVEVDVGTVSTEQVAAYLRPIQQEQTAELCQLLGREFPEWKRLYGEN